MIIFTSSQMQKFRISDGVISSAFLFSCKLRSGRSFQYWRIGHFSFQINPLQVSRGVLGKLLLLFSGKSFGSFYFQVLSMYSEICWCEIVCEEVVIENDTIGRKAEIWM
jgi:hypothetical protein